MARSRRLRNFGARLCRNDGHRVAPGARGRKHGARGTKQGVGKQRSEDRGRRAEVRRRSAPRSLLQAPGSQLTSLLLALCSLLFAWLVLVEIGVEAWYRMHERTTIATPAWSARWPEDAPGYREIKTDERVRELLRFDSAHEAVWRSPNLAETHYMFFFRWNAGSGTILRARAHRPDICLPSAGWKQLGPDRVESFPISDGHSLAFRRFTFGHIESKEAPVRAQ